MLATIGHSKAWPIDPPGDDRKWDRRATCLWGAEITIKGRTEQMSVMESDEMTPPLVGYLVLEVLDFVVDPKSQELIPNPAHDGEWVLDLFSAQVA